MKIQKKLFFFEQWNLIPEWLVRFPIPFHQLRFEFGCKITSEDCSTISLMKVQNLHNQTPLFFQKISRITQIKNGFQMWKKEEQLPFFKIYYRYSFHPLFYCFNFVAKTDLILCVHSETKKSPPRTTTLITSLEMFPSFWRRLVTGGEIDPIFARRHIRRYIQRGTDWKGSVSRHFIWTFQKYAGTSDDVHGVFFHKLPFT